MKEPRTLTDAIKQVWGQVDDQVWKQVREQVFKKVYEQVRGQVADIGKAVKDSLKEAYEKS